MKNKSIGSLILLAILAPSCGGGGGGGGSRSITPPRWEETYRKPTSVDLRVVRFGNANSGIVGGKYGTFVRTDDGGTTWHQLEHTPASLQGDVLAMAVGNTTTFAVGGTPAGGPYTNSMSWFSGDATTFVSPENPPSMVGAPWVDVALVVPASNQLAAGTLRLRTSGLIDKYQGSGLGTRDSRVSFKAPDPFVAPATWNSANGLTALGLSDWLVCGEDNAAVGQIRRTANGGDSFKTLTVPGGCKPLNRLSMLNLTTGFACGQNGTVLRISTTAPLGDNWENMPGTNPLSQNLRAIHFRDANTGWVAGNGGTICRIQSASSGTPTWQVQTTGTSEDLYDIYFADANNGYAVGNNGVVVKTSNGSAATPTWTVKSGPTLIPTFNAVEFTSNAAVGLAVGDALAGNSTLLRSLDGGRTWTNFNGGIGNVNLVCACIPRAGSGNVAFVVRDNGDVYFHSDLQGTGNWSGPFSLGFVVRSILFPKDDSSGIAVGNSGNIRQLAYNGIAVTPSTPTAPAQAGTNYAVAADPTGNTLYVAGDNSYIVQSTDGGSIWTAITTAPPAALSFRTIQAPTGTAYSLFAGASDEKVYRLSTDAVPVWTSTGGTGLGTPVNMTFVNDTTGFCLTKGGAGAFFYTTNSGSLWTASFLHVPVDTGSHALNGMWMQGGGQTGFIAGANGVLLRTGTAGQ